MAVERYTLGELNEDSFSVVLFHRGNILLILLGLEGTVLSAFTNVPGLL